MKQTYFIVLKISDYDFCTGSVDIVLKEYGGEFHEVFFCQVFGEKAVDLCLVKGDIVEADLTPRRKEPLGDYHYDDFVVDKIKFISKKEWLKY